MMACAGFGLLPLAERAVSTPKGRAATFALAPLLLLAAALAFGYTDMTEVTKSFDCVMSCSCARSYAIGAVALWALGIQHFLKPIEAAEPCCQDAKAASKSAKEPATVISTEHELAKKAA